MTETLRLPDPPLSEDWRDWRDWAAQLVRALEQQAETQAAPIAPRFTITNDTPTRTLDVTAANAADVGNVLSQLVADLTAAGTLGDG